MSNNITFSVSELNKTIKNIIESHFEYIWIEGEISNFVAATSGHWYFSLKDNHAQIRAAMFRGTNNHIKFTPENSMHILAKARISLYEPRGDYQLIVEHIEEIGSGALQKALEQLKQKLDKEGLFAIQHKKTPPPIPKQVGIITSPTGAAVRDALTVIKRRYPLAPTIIYPTIVQGDTASYSIVEAIKAANKHQQCDILLLIRGGGAIEDLWPFNAEIVARAIFASQIPIVTGIGHEIDFTIADFVADKRAPTPSAAAELITPNKQELISQLLHYQTKLHNLINYKFNTTQNTLCNLTKHIKNLHPKEQYLRKAQTLDYLEQRLVQLQNNLLMQYKNNFKLLIEKLNTISPLATLSRGYAIVTDSNNEIIKNSQGIKLNSTIKTKLAQGTLTCIVKSKD
jgi:exodeoxyribonuclease VII large subunit